MAAEATAEGTRVAAAAVETEAQMVAGMAVPAVTAVEPGLGVEAAGTALRAMDFGDRWICAETAWLRARSLQLDSTNAHGR